MSSDHRPISPGPGRTAAAARAGLFPRSDAIPGGLSLLALAGISWLFFDRFAAAFHTLLEKGIRCAGFMRDDLKTSVLGYLGELGYLLLPILPIVFVSALLGAGIPALMARKGRGHTASPLPKAPTGRLQIAAVRLFGAALFVLIAVYIVNRSDAAPTDAAHILTTILTLGCRIVAALGGVMLLIGLIELALMRHLIYRSLHLDMIEARRELRAVEGDPHIKRQRLIRLRKEERR